MRRVLVDLAARTAEFGGGAMAADISAAIGSLDLAAVTGNAAAVGMAGLITGGGYGPLTTRLGMASDSLLQAEVVLASGEVVQADATRNADLFWALRGGGGNFGVVTSMRVRLYAVGTILSGTILFPWKDAQSVLRGYADSVSSAPDELSLAVAMSVTPDETPIVVLAPTWSGEAEEGRRIVTRLQSFGTPFMTKFEPTTFGQILAFADTQLPPGRRYDVRTRWMGHLSADAIATLVAAYENKTSPLSRIVLNHFHGAGTRIASNESAFGMRREHFTALIYAAWEPDAGDAALHRTWAVNLSSSLTAFAEPGGYANLLAPDALDQIAAAYPGNEIRLAELKRRFDPDNVFSAIPLPM